MKALAVIGVILLTALGVWQLQRMGWKHELIARVDSRVNAVPVPAPNPAQFDAAAHEYLPVTLTGQYLNDRETLVQAVTRLGGGFWVLTPLRTDAGFTVLVNRGFVTAAQRRDKEWVQWTVTATVTGLIRISEPGGGFLRDNQPAEDRWYSRDVAAIAKARGLSGVAPYFVDATTSTMAPYPPVGGLTVIKFPDNHLQYALTWFALAGMLAFGAFRILRR